MPASPPFLRTLGLAPDASRTGYPHDIPAVAALDDLEFGALTMLVGENGSGKSTIIEAVAAATGFNAEGGSRNLRFATHDTHSTLVRDLELRWARRPPWGWFLRGDLLRDGDGDRDRRPGVRRDGSLPRLPRAFARRAFRTLVENRFTGAGFYVMDEPESALSFEGQLGLVRFVHDGVRDGAQFLMRDPLAAADAGARCRDLRARRPRDPAPRVGGARGRAAVASVPVGAGAHARRAAVRRLTPPRCPASVRRPAAPCGSPARTDRSGAAGSGR
ncbi:MAG: AAA family ATPase [Ilumatobacteraceae bacterium]